MAEPREWAEQLERHTELPPGNAERFAGYGVMSLPFASGHVLALRRFPASSVGPAFTSIWHRSPDGDWTFHADVPPQQSCPRYFGDSDAEAVVTSIDLAWTSDRGLTVTMRGATTLKWDLTLTSTMATRLLNAAGAAFPDALWGQRWLLATMGRLAGPLLGAGRLRLHGRTLNRQWFVVNPRLIWAVADSHARLDGRDLGPAAPLSLQARLGDFWIPQRGLFAVGQAFFEPFDGAQHVASLVADPPDEAILASD